jgi:hypothetical protein
MRTQPWPAMQMCFLDCGVEKEACPLNLAPTASTTAQLRWEMRWPWCLLDARVVQGRRLCPVAPWRFAGAEIAHPCSDVMRSGDRMFPRWGPAPALGELMREMSKKGLGATAIVGDDEKYRAFSQMVTCADWWKKGRTCAPPPPASHAPQPQHHRQRCPGD